MTGHSTGKSKLNEIESNSSNISDRVEGVLKFEEYILRNHLMVFKTIEDYFNGVYPMKRKIIAYTQVAICWMFVIKLQFNSLIHNKYFDVLTGNIVAMYIHRHDIVTQLLVFGVICMSFIGEFKYKLQYYHNISSYLN